MIDRNHPTIDAPPIDEDPCGATLDGYLCNHHADGHHHACGMPSFGKVTVFLRWPIGDAKPACNCGAPLPDSHDKRPPYHASGCAFHVPIKAP